MITKLCFHRCCCNLSIVQFPWVIVDSNDKKQARLESIRYVLSKIDYEGKEDAKINLHHDPEIVERYHRISHNEN